MLVGAATQEGTKSFLDKHSIQKRSELSNTGLMVSKIGFGSYRINGRNPEHYESLKLAIKNGLNLIDTSTNYMDGLSEFAVAKVLKELESEDIFRKHIVIISKAGYIQGKLLKNMKKQGSDLPELVKYSDQCWHSIHPEFIRSQIEQSLDRLDCLKVDFMLLHNPEYYFLDQIHRGETNTEKLRAEFYQRLFRAFIELETAVKNDKIQYYGLSSNTLTVNPEYRDFIDFDRVFQTAKEACRSINGHEDHKFKMIQFPLNLLEQEALIYKNQNGESLVEIAKKNNIATVSNRPINAMSEDRIVRLAEYTCDPELNYIPEIQKQLLALDKSEKYLENLLKDAEFVMNDELKSKLTISNVIDRNLEKIQILEECQYLETQVMHVFAVDLIQFILKQANPKFLENLRSFFKLYIEILNKTFVLLNEHFNQKTNNENMVYINANKSKYKLSEFAINVIASDPEVDVVLNGMKKEEYVYEAIRIINFKFLENNRKLMSDYYSEINNV